MNDFGDLGELYTIRIQFYTSQHHKVVSYAWDLFSEENRVKVLEYQIRSTIALKEDASELIENGRSSFPESNEIFHCLQAWNDLKLFGTAENTYFEDVHEARFELQAVLTAFYRVNFQDDCDGAITLLLNFINSNGNKFYELEPFMVLVQLYLYQGKFAEAAKVYSSFGKFPEAARDNIIYSVLESWVLLLKGESDNISNAYYFYDELLSLDFDNDPQGKFRILNVLFVLTMQLKHYPEAQELVTQIQSLNYKGNEEADFIANHLTFDFLTNGGASATNLLRELAQAKPDHQLLVDLKEKNAAFDEIVTKYSEGVDA